MKRIALSRALIGLSSLGIALLTATGSPAFMQLQTLPGSVVRGERVLTANGCLTCHALNGKGGTRAPDLAVPSKTAGTPDLFAASIWNHVPSMISELEASKTPGPMLKLSDAADLFASITPRK